MAAGSVSGSGRGGDRIVCKLSHNSSGRAILFLPDRDKEEGIPWGTTPVEVEGVPHEADFVKIAVNVLRQQDSGEKVLHTVLRSWFGEDAGQSGTTHKVAFVRTQDGYRLEPLLAATGPEVWKTYMRDEIPPLFGLEFSKGLWQQGFIRKDGYIFLLVTLEKSGLQQEFQYEDRFLSATEFQWQSQNQTARDSKAGRAIQQHKAEGTAVHLLVRPTKLRGGKAAPFYYCGELRFVSWEGDKPITVQWAVEADIPSHLRSPLGLP